MKMTVENMGRFDEMMKGFAKDNNLRLTIKHDFEKQTTHGEFRMNDIPKAPQHGYVVLWDQVKSLTEACTAIFTHVILEFKLTDVTITHEGLPEIKNVVFNDPATIVLWDDGTKTVVKCQDGDVYSKETGFALCIAKKALGNKGNFNEVFKKWVPEEEFVTTTTDTPTINIQYNGLFDQKVLDKFYADVEKTICEGLKKFRGGVI